MERAAWDIQPARWAATLRPAVQGIWWVMANGFESPCTWVYDPAQRADVWQHA